MEVKKLIIKSLFTTLDEVEQQCLDEWLSEGNHSSIYQRISFDIRGKEDAIRFLSDIDVDDALTLLYKRKRQKWLRPLRYAAAIIILIVAGGGLWYSRYTKVTPPEISEAVQLAMQQSIQSGKQDADVSLLSEEIRVKSKESSAETDYENGSVSERSSLSEIQASLTKEQLLAAKRITTRHDKEFWVTLDDGTLVHLNYNTRLIYPEKFGRGDRNVILDGEAYFMVAKDKSRPFIVHTPDGDIKVYGTEFNVNTRADEGMQERGMAGTTIVLVKGSVSVNPASGNEVMMKPGQQISIHDSQLALRNVDVEPYIAWNIGKFDFREWTLERIMSIIGRWYGYEVEYGSKTYRNIMLSGDFDRYNDISTTLEALEAVTELRFAVKNGKIIIQ